LQLAAAVVEPSDCARLKCFGLPLRPLRTQPVPSTVRNLFPFVPGGSGAALSPTRRDQMSRLLGTTVIIENRSGGAHLGRGLGAGGRLGSHYSRRL